MLPYLGPASTSDNMLFLTVDSAESVAMVKELWDGHSGAPGLLNASPIDEDYKGGDYVYDPGRKVYINIRTGREISKAQLRRYVGRVSDESSLRMKKNTQQLIAGIIILSVWYARMRDLMKALYKTIWLLSIGGFIFDDDTVRNAFYLFVLLQFNYLDNFSEQINDGVQPLNGFAMTRAGMYGSAGNGMWQNVNLENGRANGYTEGRRKLGPNENHCTEKENPGSERPGCIELAALGWVPIDQVVPIGDAICYCITTPESRVLTIDGLVSLNNVKAGDFVLTHKMNWRRVTRKIVKVSQPYHRQIFIKAPNGEWVGATDNHLWFTDYGWKDANNIYNSSNKVYNIPLEDNYEQILRMRKQDRSTCEAMPQLRQQSEGKEAMGHNGDKKENGCCSSESRSNPTYSFRGFDYKFWMGQENGREIFYPLLGRTGKETLDLSLSMGMDKSEWRNTGWIPCSSYQSRQERRQAGKFGIDVSFSPQQITLKNKSAISKNEMEFKMSTLWGDISGCKPQWKTAEILFDEMPLGTLLYDIEVEGDHSFCLEGLFAHNSHCHCEILLR